MTQDATGTERVCTHEPSARRDSSFERLLRRVARCDSEIDHIQLPTCGELVDGKYCVDALLGAGGMGAVFRATHAVSGKVVALKWLLRSADRAAARFRIEARAAARVDHPNVVDVYDIGTHRAGHYLVMELLHGRSLGERMNAGPLESAELVGIMVPLLRGVAAAHAQGVIHRDLKPENIFLCEGPDGAPREPKVLDFGISKLRVEPDLEPLTGSGTRIGTPAYMSPEQLADARNVDERTDIYALGVIMYEALTGGLPFASDSHRARSTALAPPRVRTLRPKVPRALERVVLRALAPRVDDRYGSVDALIRDLLPLLASRHHLSTSLRPTRVSLVGGGLAIVSIAVLIALAVQANVPHPRPSAPHTPTATYESTPPSSQASDAEPPSLPVCPPANDSATSQAVAEGVPRPEATRNTPRLQSSRKRAASGRRAEALPSLPRAGKISLYDL